MDIPDRVQFGFGDLVQLRAEAHCEDPDCGCIVGIIFRPTGCMYQVTWQSRVEDSHYECELMKFSGGCSEQSV